MLVKLLHSCKYKSCAESHKYTGNNAKNKCVNRAYLEESRCHDGTAGNCIIEADGTEDCSENCTCCRSDQYGSDCDRKCQEAHIERTYGDTAETDCFHDQLDGNQHCQLYERKQIILFFHIQFPPCCCSDLFRI